TDRARNRNTAPSIPCPESKKRSPSRNDTEALTSTRWRRSRRGDRSSPRSLSTIAPGLWAGAAAGRGGSGIQTLLPQDHRPHPDTSAGLAFSLLPQLGHGNRIKVFIASNLPRAGNEVNQSRRKATQNPTPCRRVAGAHLRR